MTFPLGIDFRPAPPGKVRFDCPQCHHTITLDRPEANMGLTEPEPSRSKDYILGRAAGFRAGAEAMREAAAKWAGKDYDHEYCLNLAQAIRALPLPEPPK